MKKIAKSHTEQHERIRKNIENAYSYFKDNYDRYTSFRNFVFISSVTEQERSLLSELGKAEIEFNILEAYISRLCGEFSSHEPSVMVSARDGVDVSGDVIEVIEGHVRYILQDANKHGLEYECYKDTLSGGFSAMKVYTDYTGEMSFHQDIYIRRVFDPTLSGFDPMAMECDKSDGEYCFEIFPMRSDDFDREYSEVSTKNLKFKHKLNSGSSESIEQFQWSYKSIRDDIVLVADYYEKKKVKKKIALISDGRVMTVEEYNKFVQEWEASGNIAQPPAIVGKPRDTLVTKIVRYKVIEDQIFGYEETDYKRLPIVFIDGNSILTKDSGGSSVRQVTRPYVYQAKGAQKLKNFAGQTLATEIENLGPAKMIASLESIPPQYLDGYTNPQETILYIYNAFKDGDPSVRLDPPREMARPAIPQDIINTFVGADAIVQSVLGSFDAAMSRMSENEASGVAIEQASTLSNAAAQPYIVSFLRGLESAAQAAVDLIPLYYKTPRTIPVINEEGRREYVKINQRGGIELDYSPGDLGVNVEAGVSFKIQKDRALNQIYMLMKASPMFAQFVNDEGLDIILDNVEIRNIESLRERSLAWSEKQKQMQAQAQQQAAQAPKLEEQALQIAQKQVDSEAQIGMAKVKVQAESERVKSQVKMAELEMDAQKNQVELVKALAEIEAERIKLGIEQQKADQGKINSIVDAAFRHSEQAMRNLDIKMDKKLINLEADKLEEEGDKD